MLAPTGRLRVDNLSVELNSANGPVRVLDNVSFGVDGGRTLGIVGESGSGKSMTCLSLLGLLPAGGRVTGGSIRFKGQDLATLGPKALRALRGRDIGMILQDPTTSLNPLLRVGDQIGEPLRYLHGIRNGAQRLRRVIDIMRRVHIPAPAQRVNAYPHQFSGGMRQRIAIGINLACAPDLLIADEPTTALDVTIRLQVLNLLREIQRERGMSMILVTHDLHMVRRYCDDVAVMYAGRIVEQGPVDAVFRGPAHPYTQGLLDAMPRLGERVSRLTTIGGQPPAAGAYGEGCRFAARCPYVQPRCEAAYPELAPLPGRRQRQVACWLSETTR